MIEPQSGKLIISGAIFEFFWYQRDVWTDIAEMNEKRKNKRMVRNGHKIVVERTPEERRELRRLAGLRSARGLRRLINANVGMYSNGSKEYRPIFVTLTFARNLTDIKEANLTFKKFILRLNYYVKVNFKGVSLGADNLRYIAVVEFQKRGAIHYHVIFFNLPYIPNLRIVLEEELWKQGFTFEKAIDNINNIGSYVVKYMSKNFGEGNKIPKLYQASKGLFRPVIFKSVFRIADIFSLIDASGNDSRVFNRNLSSVYTGDFSYTRVNVDDIGHGILRRLAFEKKIELIDDQKLPNLQEKLL